MPVSLGDLPLDDVLFPLIVLPLTALRPIAVYQSSDERDLSPLRNALSLALVGDGRLLVAARRALFWTPTSGQAESARFSRRSKRSMPGRSSAR